MEAKKLHPVITLLIARMESHPEEFRDTYLGRWAAIINSIREHATGDDLEVFEAAYRELRLNYVHGDAMDELLNGEERRVKEEAYKSTIAAQQYANQSYTAQAQLYNQQYQNTLNNPLSPLPVLGGGTGVTHDRKYADLIRRAMGLTGGK